MAPWEACSLSCPDQISASLVVRLAISCFSDSLLNNLILLKNFMDAVGTRFQRIVFKETYLSIFFKDIFRVEFFVCKASKFSDDFFLVLRVASWKECEAEKTHFICVTKPFWERL